MKTYDVSWNNHREPLSGYLKVVANCMRIVNLQRKAKKCNCCDDFFKKRWRWVKGDYKRMKDNFPPYITPGYKVERNRNIVAGTIVAVGAVTVGWEAALKVPATGV